MKVLCYFRVATHEQADIEHKTAILSDFADRQGYEIVNVVNEQLSGLSPFSERLKQLLKDNSADIILIPHLSCLSRNVTTQFEILKFARINSKKIISTDGSLEKFCKGFSVPLIRQ